MRVNLNTIRCSATFVVANLLRGIAAVVALSCSMHTSPMSTPASSNAAADPAGEHDVVDCPPPAAIPSDWRTVVDETGTYELRIPPTFGAAAPGKYAFIHGGQAWELDDATISLSFGHWTEYSFAERPGQRCRVTLGDANVFVIVAPNEIVAWYDRASGSHEPVVAVSSAAQADLRMLAPVAFSLRTRPKP